LPSKHICAKNSVHESSVGELYHTQLNKPKRERCSAVLTAYAYCKAFNYSDEFCRVISSATVVLFFYTYDDATSSSRRSVYVFGLALTHTCHTNAA
jgi:hypothetical protein